MTTHRVIVQTAGNPDQFRTQHAQAYIKHPVLMLTYLARVCEQCIILKSKCAAMITYKDVVLGLRLVGKMFERASCIQNVFFHLQIGCNCIF